MEARKLIDTLVMAEKLKDEFSEVDMDKVIRMILIHDLGECFTGDVPVFNKTEEYEKEEYKQEETLL